MKKEICTIILEPIGIIRTPFKSQDECPSQGAEAPESIGYIEVFQEYLNGLKGLEKFEYIAVLFNFDRKKDYNLRVIPRRGGTARGVFSTCAPARPNHIGVTIVRLLSVKKNILKVSGIDMMDGTPVIDIKPFSIGFLPGIS